MKKTTFLLVVIFWTLVSATAVQAQLYNLKSPDNSIELTVIIENDIHYSIKVDGKDVLDYSRISLTVDDKVLGKLPVVVQVIRDEHHEILKPVVAVKSAEIIDNYRSVDFVFKEKFRIEFRAYNEGVAYRFKTNFKNDIKIKSEEADFSFPNDFMTYFPEETSFHSHNERYYKNYKIFFGKFRKEIGKSLNYTSAFTRHRHLYGYHYASKLSIDELGFTEKCKINLQY